MKTNQKISWTKKETRELILNKHSISTGIVITALLVLFLLPTNVMAERSRYVLDFNDSHIRGNRGDAATLYLRKSLKQQYPWVDMSNMELRKVVLVAKSKRGKGGAQLRVGDYSTPMYGVNGHPSSFRDKNRHSFDRVNLRNPSYSSRGPWQVDLKGNFIVRKVVLEMESQQRRHRYSQRWRRHN